MADSAERPGQEASSGATPAVCAQCGTYADTTQPPLSWSSQQTRRGRQWLCVACTRDNLRAIEGKLDEPW